MFHGPYFILSAMQVGTTPIFNVFGMTGPSSNRESNPQNLLVRTGSPYRRLLQSAGATQDLYVTRELHQEPPPRSSIRSPHPGSPQPGLLQGCPCLPLLAPPYHCGSLVMPFDLPSFPSVAAAALKTVLGLISARQETSHRFVL